MGSRWLAVTWEGGGNVGPLIALAVGLKARGHQVAAVATPSLRARLGGAGLAPVEPSAQWLPDADEVLKAIDRVQPDGLIVDYMLTDALCGAAVAGLPTVVLIHTLYRSLLVGRAPAPMAMAGGVEQLNASRSRLGLSRIADHGDLLDEATVLLVTAPEELDAQGPSRANLIYTGPLTEPSPPAADWPPPAGSEPLVAVSLGTAMSGGVQRETELLQKIADALSSLPVRAIINLPTYIDAGALSAPPKVSIGGYLPHTDLLTRTDLLVTHAGLGSVCAALVAGVPMVCLPLDRDQPTNAEAVARIGAGLCLEPDCSVETLSFALSEGLRWTPRVQIDPHPGPALDALEASLGVNEPAKAPETPNAWPPDLRDRRT